MTVKLLQWDVILKKELPQIPPLSGRTSPPTSSGISSVAFMSSVDVTKKLDENRTERDDGVVGPSVGWCQWTYERDYCDADDRFFIRIILHVDLECVFDMEGMFKYGW